ncbi:MAG: hypothetical protein JXB13_19980 [Phycisphaerae bacterium]|nr:hypothetical protein [Phycisphaerae bacterium]
MPGRKRRNTGPPTYRKRKGCTNPIVTLRDSATGRARDSWLGECGTPESRELRYRLIAEWRPCGQDRISRNVPHRVSVFPFVRIPASAFRHEVKPFAMLLF